MIFIKLICDKVKNESSLFLFLVEHRFLWIWKLSTNIL